MVLIHKCGIIREVSRSQVQPPPSSLSSQLSCLGLSPDELHLPNSFSAKHCSGRCVALRLLLLIQSGLAEQSSWGVCFPTCPCHTSTGVQLTEQGEVSLTWRDVRANLLTFRDYSHCLSMAGRTQQERSRPGHGEAAETCSPSSALPLLQSIWCLGPSQWQWHGSGTLCEGANMGKRGDKLIYSVVQGTWGCFY